MGKSYRTGRLGEELRKLVGEMLIHGLKDPRLGGMVSISGVEVSRDGSYATFYVTVLSLGKDEAAADKEKTDVIEAFQSAKGLIKKEIGKNIKLRHIPELIFKIDESFEYGSKIDELINRLDIKKEEDDDV